MYRAKGKVAVFFTSWLGLLIGLALSFSLVSFAHAQETPQACLFGLFQCDDNGLVWAYEANTNAQLAQVNADLRDYIIAFGNFLNKVIVPLIITIAFVVFLYFLARVFIIEAAYTDTREEAKRRAIWGFLAFVLIFSIWGIVNLLVGTLGFGNNNNVVCPDYLGEECERRSRVTIDAPRPSPHPPRQVVYQPIEDPLPERDIIPPQEEKTEEIEDPLPDFGAELPLEEKINIAIGTKILSDELSEEEAQSLQRAVDKYVLSEYPPELDENPEILNAIKKQAHFYGRDFDENLEVLFVVKEPVTPDATLRKTGYESQQEDLCEKLGGDVYTSRGQIKNTPQPYRACYGVRPQ